MKRTISMGLMVLLVIFSALPVAAGESPLILDLDEAILLALENNPEILSAQQEIFKAEGVISVAKGGFLPSLSAGGGYTIEEDSVSGTDDGRYMQADITLSQTVYQGGKLQAYRKQADLSLSIAEAYLAEMEHEVLLEVYKQFHDILLAKDNVGTAKDALAYAESYFSEMEKKRDIGLATNLEVIRAEKLLVAGRKDLVSATNELKSAMTVLAEMLGLDVTDPPQVRGSLFCSPFEGDIEGSRRTAMTKRPELTRPQAQVKIQEQNIEIARSGLRPSVTLSASLNYNEATKNSVNGSNDDWSVEARMDIPLYDGGITKGKIIQERASLEQTRRSLEQQIRSIETEVEKAYLEMETIWNFVKEMEKELELAEESLRLAEVGYREGVSIQLDVLDARSGLTQARKQYSEALKNYNVALATLWKSEGTLSENLITQRPVKE